MSAHACLHSQLSNSTHLIHTGICWRCNCTLGTLRDVGLDADWRASRRNTWDLLRALRANGITVSPLFDAPWVVVEIFKMDWLHCVDQGVAATHLGNIFWIQIKRKEAGRNIKEKVDSFWERTQGLRCASAYMHAAYATSSMHMDMDML